MPKLTPIKKSQKQSNVPDSPSKVQARSRLGSLLGQIRKGESGQADQNDTQLSRDNIDIYDEYNSKAMAGGAVRNRKMRREKRVVFELRGKPFGLRDTGQSESIYALCRKWMYGKDDDPQDQESGFLDEHEYENSKSLDLLATREINVLPPPLADIPLMDPRPQKVMRFEPPAKEEITNKEKTLSEYKRHWKRVKKNWHDYNQKRQLRYKNSLQLLRTVYGIAQQTQTP
ncbi:hypothetical protein Mgra_00007483 [Meloidogyne graminicola]|uniref:Uncharacterized protein n=1 Tax=Meloidogyne graminicola TaxID=189291 RepID=A0A8S9ZIV0_9BILA|nr:hypothetical protein Mgra_00007483 [Meloidogyne graminicola]